MLQYIERCHVFKKTQGNLCGGIYAVSLLSEKLHQLKKDNPEDEVSHFQRMHCFYFHIPPSSYQLPGGII